MRFNTINKMRSFLQDKHKGCGEFQPVVGISALIPQDTAGSGTWQSDQRAGFKVGQVTQVRLVFAVGIQFPFHLLK